MMSGESVTQPPLETYIRIPQKTMKGGDMQEKVTLNSTPTVALLASMSLDWDGVAELANWVRDHRPECLPDEYETGQGEDVFSLFPHRDLVSDNELLVELAGRKCYDSFGLKAGRKSNAEYIKNTQQGTIPHRSIMYHAKMTFFIGGISRRVSHELIRNYVGSDRDEEGSPSQESTRFTHHYGWFVPPPRDAEWPERVELFRNTVQMAYDNYRAYISEEVDHWTRSRGAAPKGLDKKCIYEAASHYLPHSAETSFIWTTNPVALQKFFTERGDETADAEIQRLTRVWKAVAVKAAPNLFPESAGVK